MKQRIITAIVLILVAIPICIFSSTIVFPLVWALLGVVGVFEMLRCMGLHKNLVLCLPLYAAALVFPMLVRLVGDTGMVAAIAFVAAAFRF